MFGSPAKCVSLVDTLCMVWVLEDGQKDEA